MFLHFILLSTFSICVFITFNDVILNQIFWKTYQPVLKLYKELSEFYNFVS